MSEQWPNDPRTQRDDLQRALEDHHTVVILEPDGGFSVRPLTLAEQEATVYVDTGDGWTEIGTSTNGANFNRRKAFGIEA